MSDRPRPRYLTTRVQAVDKSDPCVRRALLKRAEGIAFNESDEARSDEPSKPDDETNTE